MLHLGVFCRRRGLAGTFGTSEAGQDLLVDQLWMWGLWLTSGQNSKRQNITWKWHMERLKPTRIRRAFVQKRHSFIPAMNLEVPKPEFQPATRVTGGPVTPRKGPPKFKQRQTRQFKSKPPKKGVQGFGDDIPGMEGLGTDITVICPWEAFSHLELHELAQYGII